jgi:tetratricopeptide (TPR) repeat protein
MTMVMLFCAAALLLVPGELTAQSDPSVLKREATRHMTSGRYGEAIALLNQYITQFPADADAHRMRGLCYQSRGQLENAVQDLRKAVSLDQEYKQAQLDLARAEEKLSGRVRVQIEGYKRELAKNPNAPGPYLEIAKAHASLNEKTEAESWYEEYFKRTEAAPDVALRFCELLAGNNKLQRGEAVLQQYTQIYPQNADLQSRYGYFLLWMGKYQSAQNAFERALTLRPSLSEAHEGIDQARAKEQSARSAPSPSRNIRGGQVSESPVERLGRMVRSNPRDEETRFSLVLEFVRISRFEEASRQLDTLALTSADSLRVEDMRTYVATVRDSLFRAKIAEFTDVLKDEPQNRWAMLQLAGYHAQLTEYKSALSVLDRYLAGLPDTLASDVRLRYAQYAAWGKFYDKALATLNPLLKRSPGNLEYQLLRGQIAVWSMQDLDQGVRYLNNVVRLSPNNLAGLLAMSSVLALQSNFEGAKEYLNRAHRIDPGSKDVKAAQDLYEASLRAEGQRQTFALLDSARQLTSAGNCVMAVKMYEGYLARTSEPGKTILLEYADAHSCMKNLQKAIQICDELLAQGYDFDVALMRAKNLLWSGDSLRALQELKRLVGEKPQDFMSSLYLGEAYQRTGRLSEARDVYDQLQKLAATAEERNLLRSRVQYLPAGGIYGALADFPTRVAVSPPVSYYHDNQGFSMSNYGGRLELGIVSMVSIGAAYQRTLLRSQVSNKRYTAFKGQLFIKFSNRLSAAGGFGTLRTPGRPDRKIGDATFIYEKPGVLRVGGYFEASDAAILLYTPHLIDLKYDARAYRLLGTYLTPANWRVQGSFKVITVSDGNTGSDLELRVARLFSDETFFGYEYKYTDFLRQAPYIPFSNRSKQLYYSPQNLESHSLWVEWQPQKDQEVALNFGGEVGYIPSYRSTVREISGEIEYHPSSRFTFSGSFSVGSNYRYDASYNYQSFAVSFYWSLL